MIENIQITSALFFIVSLSIIHIIDTDEVPVVIQFIVLLVFGISLVAGVISTLFWIWS